MAAIMLVAISGTAGGKVSSPFHEYVSIPTRQRMTIEGEDSGLAGGFHSATSRRPSMASSTALSLALDIPVSAALQTPLRGTPRCALRP
jgi:hypothetical protein